MKVVQVQIQLKSSMHDFQTPAASGKEKSRLARCQVEALLRSQCIMKAMNFMYFSKQYGRF